MVAKKRLRVFGIILIVFLISILYFVMAGGINKVNLISPENNSWTNETNKSIKFIFNYTGDNATALCELFINGTGFGVNNAVLNNTNTTMLANHTIAEGNNSWFVNCTNGTTIKSNVWYLRVDKTNPLIEFTTNTENNNANKSQDFVFIEVNVTESNEDTITFNLYNSDNSLNETKSYNNGTHYYNFTNLDDGVYYYNVTVNDSAGNENQTETRTITLDTTAPTITLPLYKNATLKRNDQNLTLNISVNDTTSGLDGSVCLIDVNGTSNQSVSVNNGWCNSSTISLAGSDDGNNTIKVYVNDTVNNFGLNDSYVVQIDTTPPTPGSLVLSSSSRNSLTITFSGADGACTASGSGTRSVSGSTLAVTGLNCGNSYSYTITCNDSAGNIGTSPSFSFSTHGCGGGSSTTNEWSEQKIHSWSKITPGTVAVMKTFDKEIGIKQIQIEVNNEVQDVKITVKKFDSKPAKVSKNKTGKVNKYLKIDTINLEDKLSKAIVTIQVEKSWALENNLDKNEISMFKFDETDEKWNELETNYKEEDADYYYYDVELTSFSYFSIGEKNGLKVISDDEISDTQDHETPGGEEAGAASEEKNLTWLWILIGLIVLVGIVVGFIVKRKK